MDLDEGRVCDDLAKLGKAGLDVSAEAAHALRLVRKREVTKALAGYEYVDAIGVGGSGMVFRIKDTTTRFERAMKLSRCTAAKPVDVDPENPVKVDLEIAAMEMVSHASITRLHEAIAMRDDHYCFITQLVQGAKTIDRYVQDMLEDHDGFPGEIAMPKLLMRLAGVFLPIVSALRYMNDDLMLFHMDVKPGNLLIDESGHAYVTDLGFARCRRRYRDDEEVPVGFTYGFAHPRLTNMGKFRAPSTLAKARNVLKAKELDARFDLYSFGRTMLYLLRGVERRFGERVWGSYQFAYLHLLAALLLDAQNVETSATAEYQQEFVSEIALGIKGNLLREFRLNSFSQVEDRLERLMGHRPIEAMVPELDPHYPKAINHGTGYTNATPRVCSVIDHPSFQRLRSVKHLGILDSVYPGATHTRFAHSLGVCDYVCRYLRALYNDPENPIFRVLVKSDDVKTMVAASLVHDVGQSEFGHELEELGDSAFSHEEVTRVMLEDRIVTDDQERSLDGILTGTGHDEWGLDRGYLQMILAKKGSGLRFLLFRKLLDGPVDADKLDYLQRDGRSCNLNYADGLDIHRFLSCLTICPVQEYGTVALQLGIKEKGLASSEIVALVRHKMYQSAYLQHTARCLKSMILAACAMGLSSMRDELASPQGTLLKDTMLSEMYADHLLGLDFGKRASRHATKDLRLSSIKKAWDKVSEGAAEFPAMCDRPDRSISFFYGYMDKRARALLRDALQRRVYDRLASVSLGELADDNVGKLRNAFGWPERQRTVAKVEEELLSAVEKVLEGRKALRDSLDADASLSELQSAASGKVLLVADLPLRPMGTGGNAPPVLGDIARKRGILGYDKGQWTARGHVWQKGMDKMMREITVCRLFCEPKLYTIISACLTQPAIEEIVSEAVSGWTRL